MQGANFILQDRLRPEEMTGFSLGLATATLPPGEIAASQYRRFGGIAFAHVLEEPLADTLRKMCDEGTFISDQADPGHREVESPQRAGRVLNVALNRSKILRWLEEVTGAGPLAEIAGRVVRTLPRPGDELHWHNDLDLTARRLAIVINLGISAFDGGEFELRRKKGESLLQHKHGISTSMLIFRVDPELEHRVLPLRSGGPRLVFTGWALGAAA